MSESITIQGLTFVVEPRYSAGHPLSENEAIALNQTRAENLRNNFAARVKAAKGDHEEVPAHVAAELHAEFAKYAAEYEFNGRRAAAAPRDPVEAEARKLARTALDNALRAKGIKKDSLVEGKYDTMLATVAQRDEIVAEAKRRVKARNKIAADSIESLINADEQAA